MSDEQSLTDAQIINDFLDGIRLAIIQAQKDKGLVASGKSAESLRVEADNKKGKLIDGSGSFYFQEYGRGAGKMPPFSAIYDWLEYKKYGLNYEDEAERKSLAYAIANKIAHEGTKTHREKSPTGVLSQVITKERIEALKGAFADKYLAVVLSDALKAFNTGDKSIGRVNANYSRRKYYRKNGTRS